MEEEKINVDEGMSSMLENIKNEWEGVGVGRCVRTGKEEAVGCTIKETGIELGWIESVKIGREVGNIDGIGFSCVEIILEDTCIDGIDCFSVGITSERGLDDARTLDLIEVRNTRETSEVGITLLDGIID